MIVPRWRESARKAGMNPRRLPPALCEVLELLDRVVVRGEPWPHPKARDAHRGKRQSLPLRPDLLAQRVKQRPNPSDRIGRSEKSFRRAIDLGIRLGLLRVPGRRRGRRLEVSPTWASDPSAWDRASALLDDRTVTNPWPTDDHSPERTGVPCNSLETGAITQVHDHSPAETSLRLNDSTIGLGGGLGSALAGLSPEHAFPLVPISKKGRGGSDPTRPLPLQDPEDAEAAAAILERVAGASEWRVEDALRPLLLYFDAEGVVGGILEVINEEVLPRWEAGEIDNPIGYLRRILADSGDNDGKRFGVFSGTIVHEQGEHETIVHGPARRGSELDERVAQFESEFCGSKNQIEESPHAKRGHIAERIVREAANEVPVTMPPLAPDAETVRRLQEREAADREATERHEREQSEQMRILEIAAEARQEREKIRAQCIPILFELEELTRGHPERIQAIRAIVYPNGPGESLYDNTTAARLVILAENYRATKVVETHQVAREEKCDADAANIPAQ